MPFILNGYQVYQVFTTKSSTSPPFPVTSIDNPFDYFRKSQRYPDLIGLEIRQSALENSNRPLRYSRKIRRMQLLQPPCYFRVKQKMSGHQTNY